VRRALGRSEYGSSQCDSDQALRRAREVLADALGCEAEAIAVERFERGGPGWLSTVRRGQSVFEVQVATDGNVTFRRSSGPSAGPGTVEP
jgi:hypothetical protein